MMMEKTTTLSIRATLLLLLLHFSGVSADVGTAASYPSPYIRKPIIHRPSFIYVNICGRSLMNDSLQRRGVGGTTSRGFRRTACLLARARLCGITVRRAEGGTESGASPKARGPARLATSTSSSSTPAVSIPALPPFSCLQVLLLPSPAFPIKKSASNTSSNHIYRSLHLSVFIYLSPYISNFHFLHRCSGFKMTREGEKRLG